MCLTVIIGDIGAAHAGLDVQRLLLVFSSRLDDAQRVYAARRALARAGQQQTDRAGSREVICLCGVLLDLTLPIVGFPPRRAATTTTCFTELPPLSDLDTGREMVLEASTGGFPVIRDELASPRVG